MNGANTKAGQRADAKPAAVRVTAPARLHLGFLDLNGDLGRRYGSIGLALDRPATVLTVSRQAGGAPAASMSADMSADGPEAERARRALARFGRTLGLAGNYRADVASAIPAHAGLGSGTQLALAVGVALSALEGRGASPRHLGEALERGARSAIGMAAFEQGGFIVDGGRGSRDVAPPLLMRAAFPADWRALLVFDTRTEGVHGDGELQAFARLPEFTAAAAGHLCRLVLMRLMPGVVEGDLAAFGAGLTEIQQVVGTHFAAAQGGSPWTSPAVGRVVARMGALGAVGLGQSSWGPTGFAFVESPAAADRLYCSLVEEAMAEGVEIRIARGRNTPATVEPVPAPANAP